MVREVPKPKAPANEINVNYEVHGLGEPLVLIGGSGVSTEKHGRPMNE